MEAEQKLAAKSYRKKFTTGLSRRGWVAVGIGIVGAAAVAGVMQYNRIAFVAPCVWNGNALEDCSCTHRAMSNLPDEYKPVATAWAHQSGSEHALAVAKFVGGEAKTAIQNQLPSVPDGDHFKLDPAKLKAWWNNSGGLAAILKKAGSAAAKKAAVPATVADVANDFSSNLVKARAAYSQSCGGSVDRMFAVFDGLKSSAAQTADDLGVSSVTEAAKVGAQMKKAVTNAGSWLTKRWDGWWK